MRLGFGRAGQDKVSQPGQAGQGFPLGAKREGEPGHLGAAAGDQRCMGRPAKALAKGDAAGNGQNVLHRAANLCAEQVVREIGPEVWCGHGGDQFGAKRFILDGEGHCRRQALGHINREARA